MTPQNNVDVASDPTVSVGSISLLAFLTEAKTPPVRRDPIGLWYGVRPEKPERRLDEIYGLEPTGDGVLKIFRHNSDALIAQSLPLDFPLLAGAAKVYAPSSRSPRLVTLVRGGAEKPRGPARVSHPSPLSKCVLRFWNLLNPDASLVREFTVQMATEHAESLFDFDRLTEAIEAGDIRSRSQSAQNLAQRLSELERVDAIADRHGLQEHLERWTKAIDVDLWESRDRVRLRWGRGGESLTIQLSKLAEPFLTTLLHRLLTLDGNREFGREEVSWYLSDEHEPTDLVVDYRGEYSVVTNLQSSEPQANLFFLKSVGEGRNDATEYVDLVPLVPSTLPFVTQGLPVPTRSSVTRTIDYEHVPFLRQLLVGLHAWDELGALNDIVVDYETRAKIAVQTDTDRKPITHRAGDKPQDEYVIDQIPSWLDELSEQVYMAKPEPRELLGLVERYVGSIEELLDRPEVEQKTLDEMGSRTRQSSQYKDAYRKGTQIYVEIDNRVERGANRLWYDLFHPESALRVKLPDD